MESVLTGKKEDKNNVAIDSAYGFSIPIRNIGNSVSEDVFFDITFDESAKILEYSSDPETQPGYKIDIDRGNLSSNLLKVHVPYINERELIHIAVITTGNTDPNKCTVSGIGKNIRFKKHSTAVPLAQGLSDVIIFLLGLGIFLGETATRIFPRSLIPYFGGKVENINSVTVVWPGTIKFIGLGFFLVLGIYLFYRGISRSLDTQTKRPWES